MFDTDISKGLRRKHDRMAKSKGNNRDLTAVDKFEPNMEGTVLGDLKLTEHLSNQLVVISEKFDNIQEELEKAHIERDLAHKQLQKLRKDHMVTLNELRCTKAQLNMQIKINQGQECQIE